MHRTLFSTPVVNTLLRRASLAFLRWNGWTIEGALPASASKSVLIAAPHTSNWGLPYTLMAGIEELVPQISERAGTRAQTPVCRMYGDLLPLTIYKA
jgi:hypothetical protein